MPAKDKAFEDPKALEQSEVSNGAGDAFSVLPLRISRLLGILLMLWYLLEYSRQFKCLVILYA